ERQRHAGLHLPVVLDVRADLLLEKGQIAVALLLNERVGLAGAVGCEAREVKRAAKVRTIVETAAAPVGQLETGLHEVLTGRPCQAGRRLHVRLRPQEIALGTAAGESARDDDAAVRRYAHRRLAF